MGMSTKVGRKTITIASGGTNSTYFDTGDMDVIGLLMPAALTGTTLHFQAADVVDPGDETSANWKNVYDDAGNQAIFTVATVGLDRWLSLETLKDRLAPFRNLRLVSQAAEGAARTFEVVLKDV